MNNNMFAIGTDVSESFDYIKYIDSNQSKKDQKVIKTFDCSLTGTKISIYHTRSITGISKVFDV